MPQQEACFQSRLLPLLAACSPALLEWARRRGSNALHSFSWAGLPGGPQRKGALWQQWRGRKGWVRLGKAAHRENLAPKGPLDWHWTLMLILSYQDKLWNGAKPRGQKVLRSQVGRAYAVQLDSLQTSMFASSVILLFGLSTALDPCWTLFHSFSSYSLLLGL